MDEIIRKLLVQKLDELKDYILDLHCANFLTEKEITDLNIRLNYALNLFESEHKAHLIGDTRANYCCDECTAIEEGRA